MTRTIAISPVTRIEGHASITIGLDDRGTVSDARFQVNEFRGFEKFCEGRLLWEMGGITSRICGICPTSHLITSAKDLFAETGDRKLWTPLEHIWTNLIEQKMYITGGCGALYDGASPDGAKDQKAITRVHQAYGRDYQLPQFTAHNETCANIGNVLWNWRMFLVTGEARFVDVLELALYNSVLSGVSLDGTNFLYVNPLRSLEPPPVKLRWPHRRVPFLSSFCCPPNLVRTVAEAAGYANAKSEDTLYVNLYGSSLLTTVSPLPEVAGRGEGKGDPSPLRLTSSHL